MTTTSRAERNLRDDIDLALFRWKDFVRSGRVLANLHVTRRFNDNFRIWYVIYYF